MGQAETLIDVFGPANIFSPSLNALIANNTEFCIELDLWWSAKPKSYLEYNNTKVRRALSFILFIVA